MVQNRNKHCSGQNFYVYDVERFYCIDTALLPYLHIKLCSLELVA